MEALSSVRRDAEVASKCLLISLMIRKKRAILETALEAKDRERGNEREKGERRELDHGGLDRHLIIGNNAPSPVEYRENVTTLAY